MQSVLLWPNAHHRAGERPGGANDGYAVHLFGHHAGTRVDARSAPYASDQPPETEAEAESTHNGA